MPRAARSGWTSPAGRSMTAKPWALSWIGKRPRSPSSLIRPMAPPKSGSRSPMKERWLSFLQRATRVILSRTIQTSMPKGTSCPKEHRRAVLLQDERHAPISNALREISQKLPRNDPTLRHKMMDQLSPHPRTCVFAKEEESHFMAANTAALNSSSDFLP